jgi:hypothetical protein
MFHNKTQPFLLLQNAFRSCSCPEPVLANHAVLLLFSRIRELSTNYVEINTQKGAVVAVAAVSLCGCAGGAGAAARNGARGVGLQDMCAPHSRFK